MSVSVKVSDLLELRNMISFLKMSPEISGDKSGSYNLSDDYKPLARISKLELFCDKLLKDSLQIS